MKIVYVGHSRFPTEKAHGHQIAQVCAAMARLGHDVTLLTPTVRNTIEEKAHEYYGIETPFKVVRLKSFDALHSRFVPEPLAIHLAMFSYGRKVSAWIRRWKADLLYVRSWKLLPYLLTLGIPVVLELHSLPRRGKDAFVRRCNQCRFVVCLTSTMRQELERWGVEGARMLVEGDGVDLRQYASVPSLPEAKEAAKLPSSRVVIGYVGSLITAEGLKKGIDELLRAMTIVSRSDDQAFLWIVGGPASAVAQYRALAKQLGLTADQVRFEGAIPAVHVPSSIAACDVCVYPAPLSDHPFFQRDTSPLKLFEYLASGRPVVSADLPPVRDVIDSSVARLCTAGDASALAEAILQVLRNPREAEERASKGKMLVKEHSWDERMRRILMTREY